MSYVTSEFEIANNKILEANKDIENGKALERLRENKDFQLVIGKLFLTDEMLRIVSLTGSHKLSNPAQTQEEVRENLVRDLHAKATLELFLESIDKKAFEAEGKIREANRDIAALNGESDDLMFDDEEPEAGY